MNDGARPSGDDLDYVRRLAESGAHAPLLHPRIEQPYGIPLGPKQRARDRR